MTVPNIKPYMADIADAYYKDPKQGRRICRNPHHDM